MVRLSRLEKVFVVARTDCLDWRKQKKIRGDNNDKWETGAWLFNILDSFVV